MANAIIVNAFSFFSNNSNSFKSALKKVIILKNANIPIAKETYPATRFLFIFL